MVALGCSYLGSLRLDLSGTSERTVNLTHTGGLLGCLKLVDVGWRWACRVARAISAKNSFKVVGKMPTAILQRLS